MAAIARNMRDAEEAIAGLEAAMLSPLVQSLSLEAPVVRRIAGLRQTHDRMAAELADLRSEMIGARTRGKLAGELCDAIEGMELRKDSESQSLEVTTIMSSSSLPQATDA